MPTALWRVLGLFLACALCPCNGGAADPSQRPNVVVILADDQGWGDLSVHGNTNLSTPHIDSLARDGALFERFFVCPVCSPTRAEFLTGRYHVRGGVWSTSTGGERLDLDEKTIAQSFKAAGYATGAFGKWHNGSQHPYHPNARGFDEYYGFTSGHWGDYYSPPLERNGRPVRGEGYITDDLTNKALEFIEQNRERPFFCYIPYNVPHSPMQVPDPFWQKFKGDSIKLRYTGSQKEELDFTRAALAMVENMDGNIGRVLQKLDALQLREQTIVLYFSDNGPNSWRWNGGMKGRKGSTDEGGVRSPLLVRWPGRIPAGSTVTQIAAAIDLLPTLSELAGIPIVSGKPLDGVSVAPLLVGKTPTWPDRVIFTHWNGNVSARSQQFRWSNDGKLYDLTRDPGQERDVSREHPDAARRLADGVATWKRDVLSELKRPDDRPFSVGDSQFPLTTLPARDGVPHGHVERSAKAPNCSYFTNWSSTDDRITWNVEVLTAGRYDVVINYTCPAADVGSTVELSLGERRLEGRVTEAHDPPLTGHEHDLASRGSESLVKEFKPLRLGVIELPRGRGLLMLRALEVPGKQVMDVRSLVLTRLE
jgi:arylsulfatase A-like enzyme